jgi:tetratricopeptide (TPR) repeat protein
LASRPDFIFAHALLAIDYFNIGDQGAAQAETAQVRRLIDLTPNSAMGYEALSLALWPIGKPVEAVAAAEKGISLSPQNAEILAHLGIIYNQLGRWEKSLAALKRSLAVAPDNPWAAWGHALMADDYVALDEMDAARTEAAEVERIVQRDSTADGYGALAQTLNDLGKPAEALAALEKARSLAPNRIECLWTEGISYTRLGRWHEAIAALKGYLARYPDQIQPHVELALNYVEVGRDDAARAEVAEALRLYPQFSLKMGVESESHLDNSVGQFNLDKERVASDLRKAGLN